MLLGEGTFLYDVAQEKLYVTISADGVTCSTSDIADAPTDVLPVLTLPILDEIDTSVTVGTSGSSLLAVQAAVKLLDWGVNTGDDKWYYRIYNNNCTVAIAPMVWEIIEAIANEYGYTEELAKKLHRRMKIL